MGVRKKLRADRLKEARKNTYVAKLNGCPTSPRKMRLVADMVRGLDVNKALDLLRFSSKEASRKVEKLVFILEARATEFMDVLHEPAKK